MKKIIPLIIFSLLTTLWAEEPGIQAQVELVSGTHQKARFLGIQNDTVSLGGYIQNQFTIIKLSKDKFKKIVDEQGNDLLNAPKPSQTSEDSAKQPPQPEAKEETSSKVSVPSNKTCLVAYDFKNGDSTLAMQMTNLSIQLMRENGEDPIVIRRQTFPDCDDNICIQNKIYAAGISTIYFGNIQPKPKTDSLDINLIRVFYEDSLPTLHKSQMTLSKKSFLNDAFSDDKMKIFILDAQEKSTSLKSVKSFVHIETDPEGATISRSETNTICKSPCTFAIRDTAKFALHAFWSVDQHLWGASTNINPIPGDTVKVSLKLKKISPEIRIITYPDNAEVYEGGTEITKHSKPLAHTPEKIHAFDMGYDSLLIRKPGFRDTTVSFYIAPVQQIDLSIDLEKITDFNEIEQQRKWLHDRKMLHIGQGLIGGAIGSAIISAFFMYLAHLDYKDADDLKAELSTPGSLQGKNFQDKFKKNHDLVDHGDQKMLIGGTLLGASAILLGVGLYFTF